MKKILTFSAAAILVFGLYGSGCAAVSPVPKKDNSKKQVTSLAEDIRNATTPEQNNIHIRRYAAKKALAIAGKDKIKILMLGDSITQQWEQKPAAEAHKEFIAPYNVLNIGCGTDRTQNTIWIVEKSGILELIDPKLVTIMIGTNNRVDHRATAAGIKRIVDGVRRHYPNAKILLYAIFPRGRDNTHPRRIENEKVNVEIEKLCNGKDIIWMDIRKDFLSPNGELSRTMMADLLHPKTYNGYSVWGKSLRPYFEKYGK